MIRVLHFLAETPPQTPPPPLREPAMLQKVPSHASCPVEMTMAAILELWLCQGASSIKHLTLENAFLFTHVAVNRIFLLPTPHHQPFMFSHCIKKYSHWCWCMVFLFPTFSDFSSLSSLVCCWVSVGMDPTMKASSGLTDFEFLAHTVMGVRQESLLCFRYIDGCHYVLNSRFIFWP